METLVIPAGEGRAFHLSEGQDLRIITPKGQQSADFFAFCADDISEWLSPPPIPGCRHARYTLGSATLF